MLKKISYSLLKLIGAFLAFILVYIIAEFTLSRIAVNKDQTPFPKDYTIYLLSNGVHTDIVLPIHTSTIHWMDIFPINHTIAADSTVQYIAIGWGDKGFYLETPEWSQLKPRVAFNAVTGLGDAALHITYYKTMSEGDKCVKVAISEAQYQALVQYVLESLDLDSDGKSILIQTTAQYGNFDAFYEAKGSYHLFHTCNTWTNNALKAANMKACLWNTFDKGIFYHY